MNLEHLNEVQRQAVLQVDGPLMLLAGAGSGKTRTLVTKIQYLLDVKNISPFKMLAVTFSNKAAKEMRDRISKESKCDLGALQITTFHAFCSRLLRTEANYLGLTRNFSIYDTSESKSIIKSILSKRGISLKEISPNEVLYYIDGLNNIGHYVNSQHDEEEIDKDDPFYEYYLEYQSELHKSNAVDFGGLITGALKLFNTYPEVLERYQKRYEYILVDEYQDTNRAQFNLITKLAHLKKNICVVGDEDQSIYSWRGADIRNILDFETVYSDAKLIKLEQNYRSSKNIIEAATAVITHNQARKGKDMWTDNDQGDSIEVVECQDDRVEAAFIADEIKKLFKKGIDPNEIAVFYRTNAQSRVIEDSLRSTKIPYKVIAGIKFYERKEIKDILSYMKLIVNPKDSLALSRIINVPVRGIGARTLRKIEDESIKNQVSLWEMLEILVDSYDDYSFLRLSKKVQSSISRFVTLLQELKILNEKKENPSHLYEKALTESGYYESLVAEKSYESQARIENLDELLNGIKQYEMESQNPSLLEFLETITLDSSVDDEENGDYSGEVSMMTIHGAKGLEYEYVFVAGAEENVFPSFQSVDGGEDAIEEERRLFYVAMTRAMKRLYILFAQGRMLWGSIKFNGPSRFIDEIPDNYYKWTFKGKGKSTNKKKKQNFSGVDYDDEFSQVNSFEDPEHTYYVSSNNDSTFIEGEIVKHKLYGEGCIMNSEGYGQDEKVTVRFKDGVQKKFLLKFAPIERV
ncbi:MAG: UvrD-helicase domain-containing protein [Bacteriovoracaceae bacterium]|jgi:DNA helicase-2/ATP-dependent DNA helicase PcrA|nr:UvrD-helicase domain-containing protein [Bacteriovoracaceae bacterium]